MDDAGSGTGRKNPEPETEDDGADGEENDANEKRELKVVELLQGFDSIHEMVDIVAAGFGDEAEGIRCAVRPDAEHDSKECLQEVGDPENRLADDRERAQNTDQDAKKDFQDADIFHPAGEVTDCGALFFGEFVLFCTHGHLSASRARPACRPAVRGRMMDGK